MSEMRSLGLLLLGMLFCTSTAVAQTGSRVGSGMVPERVLQKQGLTRAWWSQAVMNYRRDKLTHITNDERNIYIQCSNGIITCFDAETGAKKWANRTGSIDSPALPAATNDKYLFTWSAATLYLLDKNKGTILKEIDLPGQPSTSARADETQIYLGFLDGSMYAFDIETGQVNWRYRTSKRIAVPAVPHLHTVLFASTNGVLYSVDALTRDVVFEFEADSQITAPMAVHKDNVFLASEDYKLYAVNLNNGGSGWRSPFLSGDRIKQAPVVIKDDVYLVPEHRGLFRINADTGDEYWYQEGVTGLLAFSPENVYGIDRLNRLVIMNRDTGAKIGGLPLGPLDVHLTNDLTDRIVLATERGTVICLHEVGRDLPFYHQNPQDQPLMPQFAPEEEAAAAGQ